MKQNRKSLRNAIASAIAITAIGYLIASNGYLSYNSGILIGFLAGGAFTYLLKE